MDPRVFSVKQCEPSYAARSGAGLAASSSTRRNFYNAVNKIGDLNVINSIDGGQIGQGLRTVASISESIRSGCGSLPAAVVSSVESGANWVLEQTGISPASVQSLSQLNQQAATIGLNTAKEVFGKVEVGQFTLQDVPSYINQFIDLSRLTSNIFTPGRYDVQTTLGEHCEASPYPVDLIARAPKYKFLFIIQFIPDAAYSGLGSQDYGPLDIAFTVKRSTRPDVKFIHDDVNYYNYRTKYHTRTEYQEMTVVFHDDIMNYATAFYKAYLQAMSPISGIESVDSNMMEANSMDFVDNTLIDREILGLIPGSKYGSSLGSLANDTKQIFKEIRLYHIYDYGHSMNIYKFFNPRINTLSLDDLDMSIGNEGCEITINFSYDSVYIDDTSVSEILNGGKYTISELQRGAVYPLRYNDGSTAVEAPRNQQGQRFTFPQSSENNCDPLSTINNSSILANQAINQAVGAVNDLSTKFSNVLGGLL